MLPLERILLWGQTLPKARQQDLELGDLHLSRLNHGCFVARAILGSAVNKTVFVKVS
jgi:hypothetical protein